jgi:Zn-dependent protease
MLVFWAVAGLSALLFGVIVHELGHYVIAVALRWPVHGIGRGASALSIGITMAHSPAGAETHVVRRKFRAIALAGPAANIVVGIVLWSCEQLISPNSTNATRYVIALGVVQLGLGISNLLPRETDAPLGNDGNVVFRVCRNDTTYEQTFDKLDAAEIPAATRVIQ